MKHRATPLLATALLLLPASPAYGQTTLALTGGVNIATLSIGSDAGPVPDVESVTRASIGITLTFPRSETLGFQVGGTYSQKGGSLIFASTEVIGQSTIETNHFEITGLGRVQFPLGGDRVRAHLLAGPAAAFELSCELSAKANVDGTAVDRDDDCLESPNLSRAPFDLGVAAGGGLEIWLADKLGISLGALYTHGLQDIDTSDDSLKRRTLALRAGFVYLRG